MCRWLVMGLAGLTFGGAATAQPNRNVVRLVVWGQGHNPDSKGLDAAVLEFERRNPDIEVQLLNMGAGQMNPQKLMTAIVGQSPPDVIHQDRFSVGGWAARGAFRPLDDLIARDRARDPLCPRPEQYYRSTWLEASYDGKVYAIPTSSDDRALYWNRQLFRERAKELRAAGLDPERPPRTWSELLAYSRVLTIKDASGRLKQAGFVPNFGNSWLYMYALQNNAYFMSEDGRRCTLATPEAAEALQFMVDGYDILGGYEEAKKFESGFLGRESDPFFIGKIAMKIDGDWILYNIGKYAPTLDFGTAPAPVPDDRYHRRGRFKSERDRFITWTGGFSYAIPRGAKNVEAAWRFIKFMTSTEGRLLDMKATRDYERRMGRMFIPRLQASIETNEQAAKYFQPTSPKFADALRVHTSLLSAARTRPVTFVGQKLWDEHVRAIEDAGRKLKTPWAALRDGQMQVQRELDEEYESRRLPIIDMRVPAVIGACGAVLGCLLLYAGYRRQNLGNLARGEARWAYVFILPWLTGFLVFTLGPMIASLFFSFTKYDVLNDARWFGLGNYASLLGHDFDKVSRSFINVLYLGGIGVPLSIVTGLAVALLLNAAARGMRFYRTLFYMPAVVPGVASTVLWMWLLTPDANKGLINAAWVATIGHWFNVAPPGWLSSEVWAKPSLILMGLWGAGSGMILWLAGLKGVPSTLYEAAAIDGANPNKQFWMITLPMLSPIVFFSTVMGFIGAIQQFDGVYVITKGENAGPGDSLLMPVYHLFTNGFTYFKMGYASALAWIIFAIILVLTVVQLKVAPKWVHYETDA
jgi:multiple sugar transport system permease protein